MFKFFEAKKVPKIIPYGRQTVTNADIKSVKKVLQSDYLTQGPMVEKFEKFFSSKTSSKFSLTINSATSGLHLACLALGLKKGDYLWTSPISFVASANCGLYCGANIDFVDIEPSTGLISIDELKLKLEKAEKEGKLPKIIIPVHLAGVSCDMKSIKTLSEKYKFSIIEDASHAIGGKYENLSVGSCKYSSICVFSLHPVKIITSGEGGIVNTNDQKLYEKMKKLRSHGIEKNKNNFVGKNFDPWIYEQQSLGFNYRLTDIQCALAYSQLKRLDQIVITRNDLLNKYRVILENLPVTLLEIPKEVRSSVHLAIIRLNSKDPLLHKNIFQYLKDKRIGVQLHYSPIHLQPFYRKLGFDLGDFPNAEFYAKNSITIPLYPGLKIKEQNYIVKTLKEYFFNSGK